MIALDLDQQHSPSLPLFAVIGQPFYMIFIIHRNFRSHFVGVLFGCSGMGLHLSENGLLSVLGNKADKPSPPAQPNQHGHLGVDPRVQSHC